MVVAFCAERACWRSLVRGGASLAGSKVRAAARRQDARVGATRLSADGGNGGEKKEELQSRR